MAVTIKDVARAAGVSHTTVSRALNDSPLISDETKNRLIKLAGEMGYQPNLSAKSLKMNKAFNYGMFFSTLDSATTHNFVTKTIQGVKALMPQDYRLTIEGIKELKNYDSLHHKNYDGILIVSQRYDDDAFFDVVRSKGIPAVIMNRHIEDAYFSSVAFDDEKGVAMAIEHLFATGRRRIGFIKGIDGFYNSDRRLMGYQGILKELGKHYDPRLVVEGDFTVESGYKATRELLEQSTFDALFCSNDEMAFGAMTAVTEHGLIPGKDVAIIGFDDIEMAKFANPPLTTVRRDIQAMAKEGVRLLNEIVEGQVSSTTHVTMRTQLIRRHSG